jgi:hypothetical protein
MYAYNVPSGPRSVVALSSRCIFISTSFGIFAARRRKIDHENAAVQNADSSKCKGQEARGARQCIRHDIRELKNRQDGSRRRISLVGDAYGYVAYDRMNVEV